MDDEGWTGRSLKAMKRLHQTDEYLDFLPIAKVFKTTNLQEQDSNSFAPIYGWRDEDAEIEQLYSTRSRPKGTCGHIKHEVYRGA